MSSMPADEDHYPSPLVSKSRTISGLWRVVALAAAFIIVAVAISTLGEYIPPDVILVFVGLLAVVGVFCLFALTAGIFRFSSAEETRTVSRAIVDSLPFGAVVSDRDGKISYVNAQYGELAGGVSDGVPVGVPRLFAGQPEASEALYRLSRAARDGRPASEDVRLIGGLGGGLGGSSKPVWYRVAVRALPEVEGSGKPLVLWSVEDITRDRERQDNAFLELQRAIDYLDHAPAGFFSADPQGRVQYLNSTLADWLGYDLAEFEAGTVRLADIVRGDGASLLMRGRADGEIRTEIIDIDLVKRNGTAIPVRLLHRAARLADGELGETRTLVLDRRGGVQGEEALRASEVRFSRFFNDTPFAIATLDKDGRIVRTNAPFSRIFGWSGNEKPLDRVAMSELLSDASRSALRRGDRGGRRQQIRDRAGRRATDARGRPRGASLYLRLRGSRRFARAGQRLCARHDRAAQARGAVRAGPEDAGRGPARRRRRARLQQCADGDHRLLRSAAAQAQAGRSELCRSDVDQAERQSRRRPHAAAAGLLAPADAAAADPRNPDAYRRSHRAAEAADRRADRAARRPLRRTSGR